MRECMQDLHKGRIAVFMLDKLAVVISYIPPLSSAMTIDLEQPAPPHALRSDRLISFSVLFVLSVDTCSNFVIISCVLVDIGRPYVILIYSRHLFFVTKTAVCRVPGGTHHQNYTSNNIQQEPLQRNDRTTFHERNLTTTARIS
jgi:hypothetical protein